MFRIISYFVFAVVLSVSSSTTHDYQDYVEVSVYYESQCPDSKSFVDQQLIPTLESLQKYIMLTLIPFGKAASINSTHFECQHGPTECMGNLVQACTIRFMEGLVDDLHIAKYVSCELNTEAGTRKDLQCVYEANVSEEMVKNCVSSGQGTALQMENELTTKALSPKYIPTVTFNGIFDQDLQNAAVDDLLGTVCFILKYKPKPCELYKKSIKKVSTYR